MARSTPIHTTYSIELEAELSGVFQPGCPERGPSYASGGEPAEPASVEDVDIDSLVFERIRRKLVGAEFQTVRERFDILKGLDKAARGIIIANLIEALGEDSEIALLEEASNG